MRLSNFSNIAFGEVDRPFSNSNHALFESPNAKSYL